MSVTNRSIGWVDTSFRTIFTIYLALGLLRKWPPHRLSKHSLGHDHWLVNDVYLRIYLELKVCNPNLDLLLWSIASNIFLMRNNHFFFSAIYMQVWCILIDSSQMEILSKEIFRLLFDILFEVSLDKSSVWWSNFTYLLQHKWWLGQYLMLQTRW